MATYSLTGGNGHHKIVAELSVTTNKADNTSTIKCTNFYFTHVTSGYDFYLQSSHVYCYLRVNGSNIQSGDIQNYGGSGSVNIGSGGSKTVAHNDDGTGSCTISLVIDDTHNASYTPGDASNSWTLTLTSIERHTVTYDPNGGDGNPTSEKISNDVTIDITDTIPIRLDYTFLGWSTNRDAKVADYVAGEKYKVTGDVTFYAVWKRNIATVTYYDSAGKAHEGMVYYYDLNGVRHESNMVTYYDSNGRAHELT